MCDVGVPEECLVECHLLRVRGENCFHDTVCVIVDLHGLSEVCSRLVLLVGITRGRGSAVVEATGGYSGTMVPPPPYLQALVCSVVSIIGV